jgi:hypothetical protein
VPVFDGFAHDARGAEALVVRVGVEGHQCCHARDATERHRQKPPARVRSRPLRSAIVADPSGWTPLGMVEHLGHAERHWFQETFAATPLSAPPKGRHPGPIAAEIADLRAVVLHVLEETARHAGHLDVVRELLDGRTGLGPR